MDMRLVIDSHLHSDFSGDCRVPMKSMCDQAVKQQLGGLAFTEHLELEIEYKNSNMKVDLDKYFNRIDEVRALFGSQLNIFTGIEIGLSEAVLDEVKIISESKPFDIIIGSVHGLDGIDASFPEFYRGKSKREVYDRYLKTILEMVSSYQNYSVVGHIGYIAKYAPFSDIEFKLNEHREILEAIFKKVIETGHGIELNTSTIRRNGLTMPSLEILDLYCAMGGELITIASDAHHQESVGGEFDYAIECLKQIGFRYLTHYQSLKPFMTPI